MSEIGCKDIREVRPATELGRLEVKAPTSLPTFVQWLDGLSDAEQLEMHESLSAYIKRARFAINARKQRRDRNNALAVFKDAADREYLAGDHEMSKRITKARADVESLASAARDLLIGLHMEDGPIFKRIESLEEAIRRMGLP